jgi:carbamoyl-phosphate synthase large subunit
MAGVRLSELDVAENLNPGHTSVKVSVFPFSKFPGVDIILGPEMRSTGEVMGIDADFPVAFAKAQMAGGTKIPDSGSVFISMRESDKPAILESAKLLVEMGFTLHATAGTHQWLAQHGIESHQIKKIAEGRPNAQDLIAGGKLNLVFNTPTKKGMTTDEGKLRAAAIRFGVPIITTVTGADAMVKAIAALRHAGWDVCPLQQYHPHYKEGRWVNRRVMETSVEI